MPVTTTRLMEASSNLYLIAFSEAVYRMPLFRYAPLGCISS